MLDRSRTRFHDKNLQKTAQHFHCAVKSFYYKKIRSSMVRKKKKKKGPKELRFRS